MKTALPVALALLFSIPSCSVPEQVETEGATALKGWLSWRGPQQDGTSAEKGLPVALDPTAGLPSWRHEMRGRGTPVVADGRVYSLGYEGDGKELQEVLSCLDEVSGELIWQRRAADFLSDVIYSRYAIGSPTVDPDTGNVLWLSTPGLLACYTRDGDLVWEHSMMSEYGRLTFPNGRTGAPLVDGDLAIVHVISSGWGPQGPARDRFFAFDKRTGESVWVSTPGGPPKDSSFSMPVVASTEDGRRVLYAGLGGGHLVCVDVRTGDPLWKFPMAIGGVNSSALLHGDSIIAIHGKENVDTSTIGRVVSIRRGIGDGAKQETLGSDRENWRLDLVAFTSSPVLVGNRVYLTDAHGELSCIDADSGERLWHKKLAADQIHASPAYGDGKLYVPMNDGSLWVIEPSDEGAKVLHKVQLEGNCLAAPAIANGRIYVHTTERLYCFGPEEPIVESQALPGRTAPREVALGKAHRLQIVPADAVVQVGDTVNYRALHLGATGQVVGLGGDVTWEGALMPVGISGIGAVGVTPERPGVMNLRATHGEIEGSARLRVVPRIPFADDFEDAQLKPHPKEAGVLFAKPRPYWLGANLKWEVRDLDGSKVLARTLDRPLFQRTQSLIGHPSMSDYTMQVDIRTDGNRRIKSSGGVLHQRYLIVLKGNHQALEVSSNVERFKESVRYRWKAKNWYRLKTSVDVNDDGSATIRAKVWPRDDTEPDAWTLEVDHPHAHTHGSPGLYGFTPQSRFRVYLDNISVTPND